MSGLGDIFGSGFDDFMKDGTFGGPGAWPSRADTAGLARNAAGKCGSCDLSYADLRAYPPEVRVLREVRVRICGACACKQVLQ